MISNQSNEAVTYVLIPGCPGNASDFSHLRRSISRFNNSKIYVAEKLMFGTMADYASYILEVISGPICVIGFSFGGMVAQEMIYQQPDSIDSLVLLATTARSDDEQVKSFRASQLKELEKNGNNLEGLFSPMIQGITHPSRYNAKLESDVVRMVNDVGAEVFASQYQAVIERRDMRKYLGNISCPTLVVSGENDIVFPIEHPIELAERIPKCELELIKNCGHLLTYEHAETTSKIIIDWLKLRA